MTHKDPQVSCGLCPSLYTFVSLTIAWLIVIIGELPTARIIDGLLDGSEYSIAIPPSLTGDLTHPNTCLIP